MSWDAPSFKTPALVAAADLSAKQFLFVKVTAGLSVNVVAASTDAPVGVLQNKPTQGQTAEIISVGVTKVQAGAAIAAGAEVMANASGQAITAATTGNRINGIALEAAGGAGELIAVLLYNGSPKL